MEKPVSKEILETRKRLGLTQAQFARLYNKSIPKNSHTSREDISKYERGISDPPASKYLKFLTLKRG